MTSLTLVLLALAGAVCPEAASYRRPRHARYRAAACYVTPAPQLPVQVPDWREVTLADWGACRVPAYLDHPGGRHERGTPA